MTARPDHPAPDLDAVLAAALHRHGAAGRTALVDADGTTTGYRELGDRVDRAARRLRALGLPPASTVALCAPKDTDLVVALLAVVRAGHCVCVLEPGAGPETVRERLDDFAIARVLAGPEQAARLAGSDSRIGELHAVTRGGSGDDGPPPPPEHDPARPALLLFTSGSTGRPKGVRLTRANVLPHARGVVARTGLSPHDRLLHLMPAHHTNGVNNQILAPLIAGAGVVLVARFDAGAVDDLVARHRPTILTGVPTMFLRMLDRGCRGGGSLRMLRCGSAPLTRSQHTAIEDAFGVPLIQSYGLSEATCTSVMNPPDAPRAGSVGTALAGQTIRILAPGTDDELPVGAEGEVCIGGPTVMAGYWGAPDGAGGPDPDGPVRDGLLHTGDLGRLDADGYLTLTGRCKDVIIRGGENLAPAAIEAALTAHPLVSDAAVVGAPHHDLGEVPVAFVVPAGPGAAPDPGELAAHVRRTLSRIHVPQHTELLAALPVNAVGKIDRTALRARVAGPSRPAPGGPDVPVTGP
ncbi:class I adenylate-forming enzyme family protein [Pseudonocardia sp. HH130630-07]|uniref:class I adenylate-forming enzyme family protein n=1 Tax=Pseudonocardia sp. HH130630-07 TaxID=1690815 RepID=UPI000815178C|nr:class I adenylate-forming enzyme family protein [Pseudonocardia sp. HH130630-07]ANY08329.1 hypothetical protein AFB00_20920 [Pseudonocardia sp. HH130630-07]